MAKWSMRNQSNPHKKTGGWEATGKQKQLPDPVCHEFDRPVSPSVHIH
jgi:hypothetical protein